MTTNIFDTAIRWSVFGAAVGAMGGVGYNYMTTKNDNATKATALGERKHLDDYLDLRDILVNLMPLKRVEPDVFDEMASQLDGFCQLITVAHQDDTPKCGYTRKAHRYRQNIHSLLKRLGPSVVGGASRNAFEEDAKGLLLNMDNLSYNMTMHIKNKLETS